MVVNQVRSDPLWIRGSFIAVVPILLLTFQAVNAGKTHSSNAQEVWENVMPGLCTLWYSHAEISGTSLSTLVF
ncbi:hypothetical protein T10_3640 [Trichinella papuae]|uniref:Uncharacterized protein n=1 Tax=Trichinella papuae TaxID=268474 RepID=A0A0V1MA02_9BILA|nr:hypothetical protein T10_3640 [Trichinella papuae]